MEIAKEIAELETRQSQIGATITSLQQQVQLLNNQIVEHQQEFLINTGKLEMLRKIEIPEESHGTS